MPCRNEIDVIGISKHIYRFLSFSLFTETYPQIVRLWEYINYQQFSNEETYNSGNKT